MKKDTRNKILLTLGGLVLVSVLIFTFGSQVLQNIGGTILSVDRADFISSSNELSGDDAFLIDAVINGGGESLKATITPEMLKQYGIETVPAGDINLEFNLKDVSCNYPVTAENEIIYSLYQATVKGGFIDAGSQCPFSSVNLDSVKSNCQGTFTSGARGTTGVQASAPGSPLRVGNCNNLVSIQSVPANPTVGADASEWCYAMLPDVSSDGTRNSWRTTHIAGMPLMEGYKIGTTPSASFMVEVIVSNEKGEQIRANLTEKQTSQFLGDIGRIKWVGNLVAQEYCGQPAVDIEIVKMLDSGKFKQVDKDLYQRYQDNVLELVNFDNNYFEFLYIAPVPVRTDPGLGADVLWNKMSVLNSDFNKLYAQNLTNNCRLDNMIYKCTPTKDLIYPEIQLLLKADWVGIVIPNGEPQINSVTTASKIYDGEASIITTEIKNVGKEVDSFDVSVTCDKSIGIGSQRISITNGQSKQVLIPFSGAFGTYFCNLNVASVNNPNNKDARSFTMTILERDIPKVQQCVKEEIPEPKCEKSIYQGYPFCNYNDSMCEKKTDWTWYIVGIIAILFLIVIYFITRKQSGSRRKR